MRVIVCGGRDFADVAFATRVLEQLHKQYRFVAVIEGDARGADRIAGEWARKNGIPNLKYPADWEGLGRPAGPIRNKQMIDEGKPDLVIAFPGGRGTANMCQQAREAGIRAIEVMNDEGDTV